MSHSTNTSNTSYPEDMRSTLRQREVLKYATDIGSSLRIQMDIDTLLKRVASATCEALRFRCSALYLADADGLFHVYATCGISAEEEMYLRQHPLPDSAVSLFTTDIYRISNSYFIPTESPLWQDEQFANYFVVAEGEANAILPSVSSLSSYDIWLPTDMIVVPLMSADNTLLGLLTPDGPVDGLRPDVETMNCLELFANQAAVVIEGARLYEAARQSSEERAVLVEIGRALSAPEALHDLHSVYRMMYEQVRRVIPMDSFIVSRYYHESDRLVIDYLVDEDVVYPSLDYGLIPNWIRKLLAKEAAAFLFPTYDAYESFATAYSPLETIRGNYVGSRHPSESFIFVPIHYGDEPIGLISVQSYQPHVHTQRHVKMLQEIGVQAGIAITTARMYTDLHEAVKQAQESEQLKNHFLMTASHELRTPLTSIQGYLELLSTHRNTLSEKDRDRFIMNARRASEEVILMLSNVMDTSHVDQKRIVLNLELIQLCRAILPILAILEPGIVRERRELEVVVEDRLYVWADELRLRQVLLNIVGNALKYTPAATKITIRAETTTWGVLAQRIASIYRTRLRHVSPASDKQFIVLAIRDWGSGIALEDQEHLFSKFMRLPNATTSKQRGSGLGLYLCRELTEAMGGYIWVESTGVEGEGTTFLIALPQQEE